MSRKVERFDGKFVGRPERQKAKRKQDFSFLFSFPVNPTNRGKKMLGELYKPRGLALETAQAVLEVEDPYAVNVAYGCPNACTYCYVPRFTHRRKHDQIRLPQKSPIDLVRHQLQSQWRFHWKSNLGVFLSFLTDPFLPEIHVKGFTTDDLIYMLTRDYGIRVATLSKLQTPGLSGTRAGMTIVSLDDEFWQQYEPNTTPPDARRISLLTRKREFCDYVWVSMEPYPPSAIYKQNLRELLEELKFVDLIVFGKWNYDPRARTSEARREYAENIEVLTDFCKSNKIRCHIKSDTLNFARGT